MTTFLFIRHGATDAVGKILAGRLPHVHLNEQGRQQVTRLAERLTETSIRQILSSPLERARETAMALAERGVNIVDLSSRLVGDPPIFVLGIEADLPPGLAPEELESALRPLAEEQRVEVHLETESDEVL